MQQILPLIQSDLDTLQDLQPDGWTDIRGPIQFYLNAYYCHPYKVLIDDVLVGTGTAILHENTGWLATIITHNQYRNQGIGGKITEHLLAFLQSKHCDYIYLIATALGEPVYKRVGFVVENRYDFFKDVKISTVEISENIKPYLSIFKDEILALDFMICGENRSHHLESYLMDSFVYQKDGKISGAYFSSFGDGLIIADDKVAGIELMKKRFQKFNMASIPRENRTALDYLETNGYIQTEAHARMYYGKQISWKPQGLYNRVGGKIG